jgi:hypothetical protein
MMMEAHLTGLQHQAFYFCTKGEIIIKLSSRYFSPKGGLTKIYGHESVKNLLGLLLCQP